MPVSLSMHDLSMVARWIIQINREYQSFAFYPPTDVVEKFLFKESLKNPSKYFGGDQAAQT